MSLYGAGGLRQGFPVAVRTWFCSGPDPMAVLPALVLAGVGAFGKSSPRALAWRAVSLFLHMRGLLVYRLVLGPRLRYRWPARTRSTSHLLRVMRGAFLTSMMGGASADVRTSPRGTGPAWWH